MLELQTLVQRASDLEPLPVSVTRLASLVSDDASTVDQIAEVVGFDQGLTAKLLRYANSAHAGGGEPIATVNAAVIRLGLGQVLEVAAATTLRRRLDVAVPEYGIQEGRFWAHSVTAALAAETCSPVLRRRVPPESFTAALLHDVGKLVLSRFLDPEILELLERSKAEGGCSPLEAECEILGVHHAELGGLVCQHWKLPDSIFQGVMHHHTPSDGDSPVADVVHVADGVAHLVEEPDDLGVDEMMAELDPGAIARLGLEEIHLEALRERVAERLEEVLERFGLATDEG